MFTLSVRLAATVASRGASVACVYQAVQTPGGQKAAAATRENTSYLFLLDLLSQPRFMFMAIKGHLELEMLIKAVFLICYLFTFGLNSKKDVHQYVYMQS